MQYEKLESHCAFFSRPIMLCFKSPCYMPSESVFPIMVCGFAHYAHKKAFFPYIFWLFSPKIH